MGREKDITGELGIQGLHFLKYRFMQNIKERKKQQTPESITHYLKSLRRTPWLTTDPLSVLQSGPFQEKVFWTQRPGQSHHQTNNVSKSIRYKIWTHPNAAFTSTGLLAGLLAWDTTWHIETPSCPRVECSLVGVLSFFQSWRYWGGHKDIFVLALKKQVMMNAF